MRHSDAKDVDLKRGWKLHENDNRQQFLDSLQKPQTDYELKYNVKTVFLFPSVNNKRFRPNGRFPRHCIVSYAKAAAVRCVRFTRSGSWFVNQCSHIPRRVHVFRR